VEDLEKLPSVSRSYREGDVLGLAVKEVHLAIPALMAFLAQRGTELEHLSTRHASLEDVFVSLTGKSAMGDS
jgi:ABC-2 type transport system ATP-binding protein